MVPHDRPHRLERAHRRAQLVADARMLLHQLVFLARQLSAFQQYAIGNADLPDVVKERTSMERIQIGALEAEDGAERRRVGRQPIAVPFRAGIARFDDPAERQEQ